jgi:hypothetical protein
MKAQDGGRKSVYTLTRLEVYTSMTSNTQPMSIHEQKIAWTQAIAAEWKRIGASACRGAVFAPPSARFQAKNNTAFATLRRLHAPKLAQSRHLLLDLMQKYL